MEYSNLVHPSILLRLMCRASCSNRHAIRCKYFCFKCGYSCSVCSKKSAMIKYLYKCKLCSYTHCILHYKEHLRLNSRIHCPFLSCTETHLYVESFYDEIIRKIRLALPHKISPLIIHIYGDSCANTFQKIFTLKFLCHHNLPSLSIC